MKNRLPITVINSNTKTVIFIVCLILFSKGFSYAQTNNSNTLPKTYLFDKFITGKVLSKNGAIDEAPLNYNSEDQSIIFNKDGQYYVLANLETIDTIYISDRKFIPVNNIVYEMIGEPSTVSLLVSYYSKTRPMAAITNHDSTSKKTINEISNAVTDIYVTRPYNGDSYVEIQKRYWLIQRKNVIKANTEKQFIKAFGENENTIKNYIRESKINFNDSNDLLKLLAFGNKLLQSHPKK